MDDTKKPAARSMSRTVVSTVVGLLIVIAIAGIVLAGRKASTAPDAAPAGTTAGAAVAPTGATASAAAAPAERPLPSAVRFAASSDKLPVDAPSELARLAEAVRAGGQQVGLTARFPAGGDKAAAMELAHKRIDAVQHAMQSNGISSSRIQGEMIEVPAGSQAPGAADRVDLTLR